MGIKGEANILKGEIGKVIDAQGAHVTIGKSENNNNLTITGNTITLIYNAGQPITQKVIDKIKEEGRQEVLKNPEKYDLTPKTVKELTAPVLEYKVNNALVHGSGHAAESILYIDYLDDTALVDRSKPAG
ncbi:MAG: hypothetical protein ISS34_01930 [Candidatus Omnitrophica bacterium]|nr:hypothetical protein [Candidatus Omnitrophota bacterium]